MSGERPPPAAIRLLHLLPPEAAHRAALRLLPWLPARRLPDRPRLRARLAGIDLPHPLGLAAGLDKDGEAFAALLRQGFASVEVGTVTPRPQPGNPFPFIGMFEFTPEGAGTRYRAAARHWTADDCEKHRAMGFETGWLAVAAQLEAVARRVAGLPAKA